MSGNATLPWFKMPPRVNTADYLAFVSELLARADPAKAARQKTLEERIVTPFRLMDDAPQPASRLNQHLTQAQPATQFNLTQRHKGHKGFF